MAGTGSKVQKGINCDSSDYEPSKTHSRTRIGTVKPNVNAHRTMKKSTTLQHENSEPREEMPVIVIQEVSFSCRFRVVFASLVQRRWWDAPPHGTLCRAKTSAS